MCELYIKTGRVELAEAQVAQVTQMAGNADVWEGLKGDLLFAQGMVGTASQRWSESETAFTGAIEVYQENLLPWDEAKVYYEWASSITENDDSGYSAGRAKDLFGKALSIWGPMGATTFAEQCRAKLS